MTLFSRYVGIDYSGAETAESSLKELRVYQADVQAEPREVEPPVSPSRMLKNYSHFHSVSW